MAKVFLDTNYFIDAIHRKPELTILDFLENHIVYASPLSIHIYCYIFKIKIPNPKLLGHTEEFQWIELSKQLFEKSLNGPTTDFEDNVQLHSAAEAECNIFLTNDKNLLKMKFFGKTEILPDITKSS